MSRLSLELPKSSPRRMIWWMECDVCQTTRSLPTWSQRDLDLDDFRAAGWECGPKTDTCPACLAAAGRRAVPKRQGPFTMGDQHPAERIMGAQALTRDSYLHGDPAPTRNQVAAVLHALADHTLNRVMLSDNVAALGRSDAALGERWQQTTGLGRWFHALGDWLDDSSIAHLRQSKEPQ